MKKAPYLKTLYLQKPLVLILFIAALATLPWLGSSGVAPGTERTEYAVLDSFMHGGNLSTLLSHEGHTTLSRLIVAGFAMFRGEITPYILRLPSALSFIALMGFCFMFFAHRRPVLESFTSSLILITSSGLFFLSSAANSYILPSFLVVGGIFEMYRWVESGRKLKLVTTWLFWGTAVFELGWLVLVAPFVSFLLFQLVRKKNWYKIIFEPLLIAVPALIFGILLHLLLFQSSEHLFSDVLFGYGKLCSPEMISASFSSKVLAPFSGFMPWTVVLLVALLATPFIHKSKEEQAYNYPPVLPLGHTSQYNLLVAIVSFIGYLILPTSMLSQVFFVVCLLFTAIFFSRLVVHLSDMYPLVIRIFSALMIIVSIIVCVIGILTLFGWNGHESILSFFLSTNTATEIDGSNTFSWWMTFFFLIALVVAIIVNVIFLFRRKNLKVLMAVVGLIYVLQLIINFSILPDYYRLSDKSKGEIIVLK